MHASIATLAAFLAADAGTPATPAELVCLARTYRVTPVFERGAWFAAAADGTRVPFDDHKSKSFDERLASPDVKDIFLIPYRAGAIRPVEMENEDPGRVRIEALLNAEHDIQVAPKRGIAAIGECAFFPDHLAAHKLGSLAFLPGAPACLGAIGEAVADRAVLSGVSLELGPQTHDRIRALLQIAAARVHIQHGEMGLLVALWLAVEEMHLGAPRLGRQPTQPGGKTAGCRRKTFPTWRRGHARFDAAGGGRVQPRVLRIGVGRGAPQHRQAQDRLERVRVPAIGPHHFTARIGIARKRARKVAGRMRVSSKMADCSANAVGAGRDLVHGLTMRRKDREIKGPAEVLAIILAADSCRLGLIDDRDGKPVPYVVAMNFGFEPGPGGSATGTFWFHCAKEGLKLDLLRRQPDVCVQLDCDHESVTNASGCGWGMKYASVLARGRASIVEDPEQRHHGLDCLMAHYERLWSVPPGGRPREYDEKSVALTAVFRVDVDSLSAKRRA